MKTLFPNIPTSLRLRLIAIFLAVIAGTASAQTLTQTFNLVPGWNSIYPEVDLSDKKLADIFANVPISGVWTWKKLVTSLQFIQNPTDPLVQAEQWLVYYPVSAPESRFNTLFNMAARRPYLIKLAGTRPVTLTLTGTPSLRQATWTANAFNLRGFAVDPQQPPTFQGFFQYSGAHYNPATQQLQPIYRINPAGRWDVVQPGDLMKRGESYWVYTQGSSDYVGPFSVGESSGAKLINANGLDYGLTAREITLQVLNHSTRAFPFFIEDNLDSAPPLSFYVYPNAGVNLTWPVLPNPSSFFLPQNQSVKIRLAIRRTDFPGTNYTTLLTIRDGSGTLFYVPIAAEKANGSPAGNSTKRQALDAASSTSPYTGLWVGNIVLNAVSEPNGGTLMTNVNYLTVGVTNIVRTNVSGVPTPVKNPFNMRLIVHVDNSGQPRLLKEVTMLSQPPTYTNDANGNSVLATGSQDVLLTDPTLFGQYFGGAIRANTFVGRRVSSVHFDFYGQLQLDLTGSFGLSNSVIGTIAMPAAMPTNPFLHKYHPDHDATHSYDLQRTIELDFASSNPATSSPDPGYGTDTLGGGYSEAVTGLHKTPIYTSGYFTLQRVSSVGLLNPAPGSTASAARLNRN